MVNYKTLSIVFAVLTVAFIASTGIIAVSSGTHTSVSTVTQTTTLTTGGTAVQSSTQVSTSQSSTSGGSSYTVLLAYKPSLNFYLTNATGWTLYLFTNDTRNSGASSCYGGCATFWPAFHGTVADLALPLGINSSALGSISRTDGTRQLTYEGWPLYLFAGDKKVGDTNGQGKFGTWFVINVPQIIIPSSSTTTTATTSG